MRYEILGPIRLTGQGGEFRLTAHKASILLATLLIRANNIVPIGRIIGELWDGEPPSRASASVHVYVSQLRKLLNRARSSASVIVTRAPGYSLEPESDDVDYVLFQQTVARGRQQLHVGRVEQAADMLEEALAYWRGVPFGGFQGGPIVGGFVCLLEESRLECLELLIEANLALNRHREAVSLLYSLIAENPLREAFYELLMLALYRSNRQADALSVYQDAREILNRELGLEPCRALRNLQQAILTEDSRLYLPIPPSKTQLVSALSM